MSDYTNSNISRSEGVGAKGLLIAVVVLVGLVFVLSLVGGGGEAPTGAETAPMVGTEPAVPAVDPAAPAVVE